MSFFAERGILHAEDSKLKLDAGAVAAALPASVQGVLNARSAALKDRTLLQVASVIGRGFKPDLLTFNPFFPVNTLMTMRGAVAAQFEGVFDRYVGEVFRNMCVNRHAKRTPFSG